MSEATETAAPAPLTAEQVKQIFEEKAGVLVDEILEKHGKPAAEQRKNALSEILGSEDSKTGRVDLLPEEPRGKRLARMFLAIAAGKGGLPEAIAASKGFYEHAGKASTETGVVTGGSKAIWDDTIKSLEASTAGAGGVFVPEDIRAELIPLLRANNVVRASGAQVVPMPFGNSSMNFQASTAVSTYLDELQAVQPSQPSYGRLKLAARKLMTLVPISNDMIRFGMAGFDAMIRDDIVESMGNREDLALIRDPGSENTPKGLRFLADPANVVDATDDGGSITVATVTSDLAGAVQRLEDNNIQLRRPGWLITPRTKWFLMSQRGADGAHIWRDEMRGGTIFGFPFRTTTQIPNNLGGGSDESEVFMVDFSSIVIGDAVTMEVDVFDGAAYLDGADLRSGVSRDEKVMRGISEHDITARQRGREISVITAVDWTL